MTGITRTQYGYNTVKFITKDDNNFNVVVDITAVIANLHFFESLGREGIVGRILVVDTENIFAQLQITGVEKIRIDMNIIIGEKNVTPIRREFMLTSVLSKEVVNDSTISYVFELQEPHMFRGKIEKISKSFVGTPLQIIRRIASGYLAKKVDVTLEPVQSVMSVITPYLTPLGAMKWISYRATDKDGFPYYLYSTLNSKNLQFKSLSEMMNARSHPSDLNNNTYTHSGPTAQQENANEAIRSIEYLAGNAGGTTLSSVIKGAVGQRYEVLDLTFNEKNNDSQVRVKDYYDGNLYNKWVTIDNKFIDDYESAFTFDIQTPSMTFGNSYGYDEDDLNRLVTKVVRRAIITAVETGTLQISVNAHGFMANNIRTIGHKINIVVLQMKDGKVVRDKKQSGEYLIVEAKHNFYDEKHDLSLKVVKV